MNFSLFRFILLVTILQLTAGFKSYKGYKTYRVLPENENDLLALERFSDHPDFDFWSKTKVVHTPLDIMVQPYAQKDFENHLYKKKIPFNVLIDDVEKAIQKERRTQQMSRKSIGHKQFPFDKYYQYDEILEYFNYLQRTHPDIVKVMKIGKTFEGRPHYLIKISTGGRGTRPIIFIDAGIHAREWAAPATILYLINQLVENNQKYPHLLNHVDWYILPVVNPDGYEYTHTEDRFWRKSRSVLNTTCVGVDLNRNFGFHWGESGTSCNPCSEIYRGPEPFSEVETMNIRNFVSKYTSRIKVYLTFHTFGNLIFYPWSYSDEKPDDWRELDELGQEVAEAIKSVRGTVFTVGTAPSILYEAAGNSFDYIRGELGVKYAYAFELGKAGMGGFDPPITEMPGIAIETFQAFKVFAKKVASLRSRPHPFL